MLCIVGFGKSQSRVVDLRSSLVDVRLDLLDMRSEMGIVIGLYVGSDRVADVQIRLAELRCSVCDLGD